MASVVERGAVYNRSRAKQLRDFTGLRFGRITPTDIDGLIEYQDRKYVIIEAKYGEYPLPDGQYLALKRLCDDLQKLKPTILVVARHYFPPDCDVDYATCEVDEYRFCGKWYPTKWNVRELVDRFLKAENK